MSAIAGCSLYDLLVVWCSIRGEGSRAEFETACRDRLPPDQVASRVLNHLQLMGHVDVDWAGAARWQARLTGVTYVGGTGGNAVVTGARTDYTWKALQELERHGVVAGLTRVVVRNDYPSSWFVAGRSPVEMLQVAAALDADLHLSPTVDIIRRFGTVAEIVDRESTTFIPSGFGALRFDVGQLRFRDMDDPVRWGQFPPGCYQQRSRGRNRYIFVDDALSAHVLDRWVAIHAELARHRRSGAVVAEVLRWDKRTERMSCLAAAQLPTSLAHAAVLCSGLAPRRYRSGRWADIYEGVTVQLYDKFCNALDIPRHSTDLSIYDEGAS